jgi:hypothetical protein
MMNPEWLRDAAFSQACGSIASRQADPLPNDNLRTGGPKAVQLAARNTSRPPVATPRGN